MTISSIAFRQLSDGNSQGQMIGQSATDPIGFYNVTTVTAQLVVSSGVTQNSISSGALASTIAVYLHRLGLINCSTINA